MSMGCVEKVMAQGHDKDSAIAYPGIASVVEGKDLDEVMSNLRLPEPVAEAAPSRRKYERLFVRWMSC